MWLLHVVVVQGGGSFSTGVTLWLTCGAVGLGFAFLAGELADLDALLVDLALAAAGGVGANLLTQPLGPGADPVAFVYDVRVFYTAFGALFVLCLAHDLVRLAGRPDGERRRLVISDRGGFAYLFAWVSGWPVEPGVLEASYDGGLRLKLFPDSLHYQVHAGPLTGARAVPLVPGLVLRSEPGVLDLSAEPGSAAAAVVRRPLHLDGIEPPGSAEEIERLARAAIATAPASIEDVPRQSSEL
jgi:hypothetical protein